MEGFNELLDKMKELHRRKNADYASEEDPFKNFRVCENLGLCSLEKGILVRKTDKLSRIINLLDKENQVKDESILDTLLDDAIYDLILICFLQNKKKELSKK